MLYLGDCLEQMNNIADNSVDMVLCDLPYGTTQNKWDSVIDLPSLWKQYDRVCKENAAVVLFCQGIFTARLMMSNESWFKYKIVWEKSKPTNFLNAKKQPLRKHEDIAVFYKSQPVYNPQFTQGNPYSKGLRKDQQTGSYGEFSQVVVKNESGRRYPTDVVYYKTAESEPEKTVWHPTQKPVELGQYLIRTYTNAGAVILDNAFGSGSFLVSAKLENRNYIGIEKEEEFFDIAQERLRRITIAST